LIGKKAEGKGKNYFLVLFAFLLSPFSFFSIQQKSSL